jgi:hypothetical protein
VVSIHTALAILFLSPIIPAADYQCESGHCVKVKKKTREHTKKRYQASKATHIKRSRRNRKRTRIKRKRTLKRTTTIRRSVVKPPHIQITNPPRKIKPAKQKTSPKRRTQNLLLQWTTEILLSDPDYGRTYRQILNTKTTKKRTK